jgi:branched-chain amino acid transport system ATP-binding protein
VLEVQNLVCRYGKVEALKGVSLTVMKGELVTLIGANGAGKTTTLKAISGVLPVAAGKMIFEGEDITRA